MTSPTDPSRFLRRALRANASFSLLSGIAMLAADGLIAALLGAYDHLGSLHFVGANLLAFSALLFLVASRERIPANIVIAIIAADALWVVFSWIAIGAGATSGQGAWAVGTVADVVLLFAILQTIGLRRMQRTRVAA